MFLTIFFLMQEIFARNRKFLYKCIWNV